VILWKRAISVLAAGLTIRDLRIVVSLRRETDQPITGRIQILNLRPEHQHRLTQLVENEGQIIVLAGHSGRLERMFDGLVKEVGHERQRTDVVTNIRVGSTPGTTDNSPTGWISNRRWKAGTLLTSFVEDLVRDYLRLRDEYTGVSLPLTIGDKSLLWSHTLDSDVYASATDAPSLLREVLASKGLTSTENDGVIEFSRERQSSEGQSTPIILSRNTGLLYLPIPTDEGVNAVSLLKARARIGGTVVIQSKRLSGRYRIVGLQHNADNWSGNFHTRFRMRAFGTETDDVIGTPRRTRSRPPSP